MPYDDEPAAMNRTQAMAGLLGDALRRDYNYVHVNMVKYDLLLQGMSSSEPDAAAGDSTRAVRTPRAKAWTAEPGGKPRRRFKS